MEENALMGSILSLANVLWAMLALHANSISQFVSPAHAKMEEFASMISQDLSVHVFLISLDPSALKVVFRFFSSFLFLNFLETEFKRSIFIYLFIYY